MLISSNEIAVVILVWILSSMVFFVMGETWEMNNRVIKTLGRNQHKEKLDILFRNALAAYLILEDGAWPYINDLYASVLEIGGGENLKVFKEAFQKEITSSRFRKASSTSDIEDFELYVDWV